MEDQEPKDTPPPPGAIGCIFFATMFPIFLIVSHFYGSERAYLICILLGMFALIVYKRRDIIGEDYFIAIAPPLFLAQFVLALWCPLPQVTFYKALGMPFALAVLFLDFAIIRLSERLLGRRKNQP